MIAEADDGLDMPGASKDRRVLTTKERREAVVSLERRLDKLTGSRQEREFDERGATLADVLKTAMLLCLDEADDEGVDVLSLVRSFLWAAGREYDGEASRRMLALAQQMDSLA